MKKHVVVQGHRREHADEWRHSRLQCAWSGHARHNHGYIYCTSVVSIEQVGCNRIASSFQTRRRSQITSLLEEDRDRCSTWAEDLEIVVCFLHFHDMRESLKNMHHPIVDRLVSGHLTNLDQHKPWGAKETLRSRISHGQECHKCIWVLNILL